jgi:hypothetical protein
VASSLPIHEAPHGINLVVETPETVYIGRFDHTDGFQVVMRDCAIRPVTSPAEDEAFVKNAAKYGIPVDRREVVLEASRVGRVRRLGDIPKD